VGVAGGGSLAVAVGGGEVAVALAAAVGVEPGVSATVAVPVGVSRTAVGVGDGALDRSDPQAAASSVTASSSVASSLTIEERRPVTGGSTGGSAGGLPERPVAADRFPDMWRLLLPAMLLLVAACGDGSEDAPATATRTAGPSPSGSATPSEHPTGPAEVVIRLSSCGGLVFNQAVCDFGNPLFVAYGDGRILRLDGAEGQWQEARLDEAGLQALIAFVLEEGRFAEQPDEWENTQVADAPTHSLEVNAGGLERTVSAYALGLSEQHQGDPLYEAFFEVVRALAQGRAPGGAFSAYEGPAVLFYQQVAAVEPGAAVLDLPAGVQPEGMLNQFRSSPVCGEPAAQLTSSVPGGRAALVRDGAGDHYLAGWRPLLPQDGAPCR
jgi:hypothetical protein